MDGLSTSLIADSVGTPLSLPGCPSGHVVRLWLRSQTQRPREQRWKTTRMTSRTRHACTHSQLHGGASPERSGEASSHGSGQRPAKDAPGGASVYHRRCHPPVANYADATGPQSPDLLQRTHHGLAWTPKDGLYNLCHVVPRGSLTGTTNYGPHTEIRTSRGPTRFHSRPFSPLPLVRGEGQRIPRADEEPASYSPAQLPRIGPSTRCRRSAATLVSCQIPTRQQREQRCPSPTPDSIAGQVSIGPTPTNPANTYAIAGNGQRALQPHLTARQQSQH